MVKIVRGNVGGRKGKEGRRGAVIKESGRIGRKRENDSHRKGKKAIGK